MYGVYGVVVRCAQSVRAVGEGATLRGLPVLWRGRSCRVPLVVRHLLVAWTAIGGPRV